jgi:hypothetical protein
MTHEHMNYKRLVAAVVAAVKAGVRTFPHPSGPQHRYYSGYFWQKILSDTEAGTRTEELN